MTAIAEETFDHNSTTEMVLLDVHGFTVAENPAVRRQSALAMLGKFSQETIDQRQLFVEAAVLAARTLESDHFVAAQFNPESSSIVALSGERPEVQAAVELVEHAFDQHDRSFLVAQAIDSCQPIMIGDLSEGDSNAQRDPLLTALGAASAMICPVHYAGHQYGAIGVLFNQPKQAPLEDILFLQSLALLLGPTVAYQRTEAVLAQHTAMLNATMDSLDTMVLVLAPDGKIIRLNRACEERTGFRPEELRHRHFWGAYLLPEEVAIAQAAFGKLRRGQSPVKCEMFLLTKSGERRRVAWSFTHLPASEGGERSYVASGIDVTEQHAALESLERAEANVSKMLAQQDEGERSSEGEPAPIPKNRRSALRKAFPYMQLIGPMREGRLPSAEEFKEVRCRDISPSGFSYITNSPPDFQELVVALGAYPSQLYLTAQVVHVNRYREDGQDLMLVGCSYTSRVNL